MNFIRNQELIKEGEKTLLAVSGGLDSIVMTQLFVESGFSAGIAHCNFQLRSKESDEDEFFVKGLSEQLGIPFFVKKFRTEDFARESGVSIQMAARELRYHWLKELAGEKGYVKIALAHHKDDQLETIIFNLAKGTGIAGLTGMQPKNRNIIRPLLFTDRVSIEEYANRKNLKWREDSSNESLKYKRNMIRHKIIPVLREINPGLLDTLDLTLLRLIETESVLNENLVTFLDEEVVRKGEDIYIQKKSLESSTFPALAMHAIASPFGFNFQQCVNIIESLGNVGNLFYGTKGVLNIDRTELILSPLPTTGFQSNVFEIGPEENHTDLEKGSLTINRLNVKEVEIEALAEVAFLDFDKLKFPLKVRHWAAGDWFIPLGMKGKKKISDLMIDEKIPLNLKNRVWVLESAKDIAWVIGHRIDDRFKITPETKTVWKAKYEED